MAVAVKKSPPAQHNPPGFAQALLNALGIQATATRIAFLNVWFAHEGNNGPPGANGVNNPLNVFSNGRPANYATFQQGVASTASVIKQSNMAAIYNALRNPKATPTVLATAVENSPWDGGHYGATPRTVTDSKGKKITVWVGGSLSKSVGAVESAAVKLFVGQNNPAGIPGQQSVIPSGRNIKEGIQSQAVPGTLVNQANDVKNALTSPLTTVGKDVLYGLAILGGGALMIVGFILVAADIGLEKARSSKPAKIGLGTANALRNNTPRARHESRQRTSRQVATVNRRTKRVSLPADEKPKRGEPGSTKLAQGDKIPF